MLSKDVRVELFKHFALKMISSEKYVVFKILSEFIISPFTEAYNRGLIWRINCFQSWAENMSITVPFCINQAQMFRQ